MKNRLKTGTAIVALSLSLSACAGIKSINNPPEMSSIAINEDVIPEVNKLQIPMPDKEAPQKFQRAEATSLWQVGSGSFFKDQRAKEVGDVLTVNIEISDKATLSNETETDRKTTNQMGFPTFFGYQTKLPDVLPGITSAELPNTGNVIDIGAESSLEGSGSVARNEKISLKVAAMIMKKLPNGTFVIAGRQEVRVNHELRELRVVGVVRKEDIESSNTISYEKIAEARISYGGRGIISDKQRPQYGQKMLDVVVPF